MISQIEKLPVEYDGYMWKRYRTDNGCKYTEHSRDKVVWIIVSSDPNGCTDPVSQPAHYLRGKIEVLDFINDQQLNFARGSCIKYVCRAGHKDPEKEVEDLRKAIYYLEREVARLKK